MSKPASTDTRALAAGEALRPVVIEAAGLAAVAIPYKNFLLSAQYARVGEDLLLTAPDGTTVLVRGFFSGAIAPSLLDGAGTEISGDLVTMLATSPTAAQTAEIGGHSGPQPIGIIEKIDGAATIVRADGSRGTLSVGTLVFERDVIETGPGSRVALLLVDKVALALEASTRLVVDNLQEDWGEHGRLDLAVLKGTLSYAAGPNAPEVGILTPQASITATARAFTLVVDDQAKGPYATDIFVHDGVALINAAGTTVSVAAGETARAPGLGATPSPAVAQTPEQQAGFQGIDALARDVQATGPTQQGWQSLMAGQSSEGDGADDPALERIASIAPAAGGDAPASTPRPSIGGGTIVTMVTMPGSDPIGTEVSTSPADEGSGDGLGQDDPTPADLPSADDDPSAGGGAPAPGVNGNQPPIATDDTAIAAEDGAAIAIAVLANDTDADAGDTLQILSVGTTGAVGTVTISGGQIIYDPGSGFQSLAAGATATDTFAYTVRDAVGATSTATVTVTVTGTNDAPLASGDAVSISGNSTPVAIDVLANDSDPDTGDTLTVIGLDTTGTIGTVGFSSGGVTYDPAGGFQFLSAGSTATDTFSYTIRDAAGVLSTATVTVTVIGVNNFPQAVGDSAVAIEDGGPVSIDVLANDTDPDSGDVIAIQSVDVAGTIGTVAIAGSGLTYDPVAGFQSLGAGATATDTFTYTIVDSGGLTSTVGVVVTISGVNDAPVAQADAASAMSGAAPVLIGVLANDTDVDSGDALTILSVDTTGTLGSVGISGSSLTYDPGAAFSGLGLGATATDTFTYTIRDAAGAVSTATVTVTVSGASIAPVATPDVAAATEDGGPVSIAVLANDTDADAGDTLSVISVDTTGTVGAVSFTGSGVTYDPGANYQALAAGATATDTFTYTIRDLGGQTSTASVTVTITGVNDAPVAVADAATVVKDSGPVSLAVLANDTDVDTGDSLSVLSVDTTGTLGQVTFSGSGVSYDPGAAFSGLGSGATATDTFTYTIRDAAGAVSTATVTVTITGSNQAPVAVADSAAAVEDGGPVAISVLANDTDADAGDSLTVLSVNTTGTVGSVSFTGSGVTYDPGANFQSLAAGATATDTFTYTIRDAVGSTSTATVSVTITGVNDAPNAFADSAAIGEDSSPVALAVLANDTDTDTGDSLTVLSVDTTGTVGSVSFTGTGVTYDPGANFQSLAAGATATDTFTYTIQDAAGATSTASVTVTITGTNDAPVAVADSASATEDGGPVALAVLANDTAADAGDSLTVLSVDTTGTVGSVSFTGTGVTYDPGANFQSLAAGATATDTFTYTIQDAAGATSTASVTVTITGSNDAPVAVADSASATEDAGPVAVAVLANDTDADTGDSLTVLSVDTTGTVGSVSFTGAGVTYDPGANFQSLAAGATATDTFTYTIRDAAGATSTASVTVTVTGTNDAPVAVADSLSVAKNSGPTALNVLANDTDVDTGDSLSVLSVDTTGTLGQVTFTGSGVSYDPGAAFSGLGAGATATDTFTYTTRDAAGAVSTATVTVTITGNNQAPVAVADSATAVEDGGAVSIAVLANDTDADAGDSLTVLSVDTTGTVGSVSFTGAGVTYDPGGNFQSLAAGATATDTFTYTIQDAAGATSTASVTVTINGSNDAPTAVADAVSIDEDNGGIAVPVLANDTDPDAGDSLSVIAVGLAGTAGSVSFTGSGVTYNPGTAFQSLAAGATATDSFTYTISDAAGLTSTASVTVTVTGNNDAPVAVADSTTAVEGGGPISIAVLANDTDIDTGDTLSIVSVNTTGTVGSVSIVGGTLSYDPGEGFSIIAGMTAVDTFTYTVQDAAGATSTATVSVTVSNLDDNLSGGGAADLLNGMAGNDTLSGNGGNDTLLGGPGTDLLIGGAGNDSLDGGNGNDTYRISGTTEGADTFRDSGASGTDRIVAGANNTNIGVLGNFSAALTGIEEVSANGFSNVVLLGDGTANTFDLTGIVLTGLARVDLGAGNDTLLGTAAADVIQGGAGNDSLNGAEGGDTYRISGTGDGTDSFRDSGTGGTDTIVAGANNTNIGILGNFSLALTGIEAVSGAGFSNVVLLGDGTASTFDLSGMTLDGLARIDLGAGNDTFFGSAGADVIQGGTGNDSLDGGEGADTYRISGTGDGTDTFRDTGSAGIDTIIAVAAGTVIRPSAGFTLAATGIEAISGNGFANVSIAGGTAAELFDFTSVTLTNIAAIDTGTGNDTVVGSAGGDTIVGNGGNDSLNGGESGDIYRVTGTGHGMDFYRDTGTTGSDRIEATAINTAIGIQGDFNAALTGIEEISANGFAGVRVLGDATANLLDFSAVALSGLDAIDGGSGNDTIVATAGADALLGNAGNDSLDGGEGGDTYRVSGASHGADLFRDSGTTGTDRIIALASNTAIGIQGDFNAALTGIEEISANGFAGVRVLGDATANLLDFSAVALSGLDAIDGGSGNDTIVATAGADALLGNAGNDSLDGGEGGDTYRVSGASHGADLFRDSGTTGTDRIIALASNTAIGIQGDFNAALTGIEEISANGFAGVRVLGDATANLLDFSAVALSGLDAIDGGSGNDTIFATAGADALIGNAGNDSLNGGEGGDTYRVSGASHGADLFRDSGTTGTDRIIALANNTAIGIQGDFNAALTGIEEISANGFTGVRVLGDATANQLDFSAVALSGLDAIDGGSGNDTIFGTAGADALLGNAGNDSLDGGEGGDTYRVSGTGHGMDLYRDSGTAGADRIIALANNTAIGIQGNFSAALTGIEEVSANGFTGVSLLGDTGANAFDLSAVSLVGLARIDAGGGSDTVLGSTGADLILGNAGDDRLNGGLGNDTLTGGAGDDVFVMSLFSGQDRISDFTAGGVLDRIDLTAITIADTDADGRDFDDVLALSTSDGLGNVLIDLGGGNTLTLAGVSLAALRPIDFIL